MIKKYVRLDRSHVDFFERFMEKRIQKLDNIRQLEVEDFLPFPIESSYTTPTTLLGNESATLAVIL